jgi:hypothetical protein
MEEKTNFKHDCDGLTSPKVKHPETNKNGQIFYMPSNAGFTQKQTDSEIHYFGLVSKIPFIGYPYNIFNHDIQIADLFTVLNYNSRDMIPMENGIIERYEIQDINSFDVHVMYRVPYVHLH